MVRSGSSFGRGSTSILRAGDAREWLGATLYTALYMSTRTQIYLTGEQRARLDELVRRRGGSLAELIREAVDAYLAGAGPGAAEALEHTFGRSPDFAAPPREEWRKRDERLSRG